MTRSFLSASGVVLAALILVSQSAEISAQPTLATGRDAEVTEDGLYRVDRSIMNAAWVRPDFDLALYTKIFCMPIGVSFRPIAERNAGASTRSAQVEFAVSDERKVRVRQSFSEAFLDDITQTELYDLSSSVGRDVLMVQGFLVDVVSNIPPEEAGTEFLQRLKWEATLVLELRDSMSNDILARTVERERLEEVTDSDFAEERTRQYLRRWARVLRARLEALSELSDR